MNRHALLSSALALLERKSGNHCTGALARNGSGNKTAPTDVYARSWDAIGAVLKAARTDRLEGPTVESAVDLLHEAAGEKGFISAAKCNDTLGLAGALWMLRRALQLEEGPPARADREGSTR